MVLWGISEELELSLVAILQKNYAQAAPTPLPIPTRHLAATAHWPM